MLYLNLDNSIETFLDYVTHCGFMDEEYESDTEGVGEGVGSSTPFVKRSKRRGGRAQRGQMRNNAIISWDRDGQGISNTMPPSFRNNLSDGGSLYRDLDSRDNRLFSRLRRFLFS